MLGEGPRGTLTKTAIARLGLDEGRDPQVYAVGIKELWKVPNRLPAGSVIHTLGAPLWNTFGGGWIYAMTGDIIDIGLVTGLDYADPTTDPHDNFQRYKLHPAIRPLLEGGEMIRYGAKAIPEGGLHAMPRFYADGLCIVGDTAGFLNGMRLKGIHLAMKSGMLAAEAIFDALAAGDTSADKLGAYEQKFRDSWAFGELHAARNFHQGFSGGIWGGLMNAQLGIMTGGRGFGIKDKLAGEYGHERLRKLSELTPTQVTKRVVPDGKLTFDKVTDVFKSGTMHDESQPAHPARRRHDHLRRTLHRRVRQPVSVLLPGRSLRAALHQERQRARRRPPADQLRQLRALQDLRHHGPLPDHHLGPPQGGEGPGLHRDVRRAGANSSAVTITINGETREVVEGSTVDALLEALGARRDGTAVALNDDVVPRGRHAAIALHEGDRLEIIVAVAGG